MRSLPKPPKSGREGGSGLILIMVIICMLFAFMAALLMTTTTGVRALTDSEGRMRSFYLADSGAQSAIAKVRASKGSVSDDSFSENLNGGTAQVTITKESSSLLRIDSTGVSGNLKQTVELYIKIIGSFSLPGVVTVEISPGAVIKAPTLRVQSYGTSTVSGKNHSANGSILADQSKGKYAMAANPVPGNKKFSIEYDVQGASKVEGIPAATTNNSPSGDSVLKGIRDAAMNSADVMISGSMTLGTSATNSYGTSGSPKLVYARLGAGQSIQMQDTFIGYGTLVIDVDSVNKDSVLKMAGSAAWNGLILVYIRNDAEVANGSLVSLSGTAKVVGGLAIFLNAQQIQVNGKGVIMKTEGDSSILYSDELISLARGTESLSSSSARVISYQIR